MKAAMASVPVGAKVMVLMGWFLGALAGTFLAAKIARSAGLGVIVGASLLTMAVLNMLSFPHPLWMWVGAIVFYLAATWLGVRLGAPKGASATPSAPAAPTPA